MKRRYHNETEIQRDIDKWKAKAQKFMDSAAALDLKADSLFLTGRSELVPDAQFAREEAKKRRKSAFRIQNRKLVLLKEKLAEFLTEPLPGTGAGKDIQAT